MKTLEMNNGPMFNAYPDSLGGKFEDIVSFLKKAELKNVFDSFYVLPSMFNTDLDRGFSVIDYTLNEMMVKKEDLEAVKELGINLKLDFILNHASVLSPQFQDLLQKGEESIYKDFFINWNDFWCNNGEMKEEGYIVPNEELIKEMFFRKPGLPILMVQFPNGKNVPYWNTFYQEIKYPKLEEQNLMQMLGVQYSTAVAISNCVNCEIEKGVKLKDIEFGELEKYKELVVGWMESKKSYLGQMDLNIKSPLVWDFYDEVLGTLSGYGAQIVRLDAFAYAPKEVGEKNFLNEPTTWEVLEKVRGLADKYELNLLPEIHTSYMEKMHERISEKGYMTYDFFLPGLIIDAIEEKNGEVLERWAKEIQEKGMKVVNMLGCHDGIPVLDLKGIIPDVRIKKLIDTIVSRGGYVKDLHGQENMYYQVNATYYSALGEDDKKMLLARALQLFMPGKPQIWYLDLFAMKNDYEGVKRAGEGGHKEINRTNLTNNQVKDGLERDIVKKQLELLKFRATSPAFGFDSQLEVACKDSKIKFVWTNGIHKAVLKVDLETLEFKIIDEKLV
ncbi:MAG: glycosidase [Cellulosilyticaceae bacterium]